MFTGIIEEIGEVAKLEKEGTNLHISVTSKMQGELKIDQSVAHNGVCLTVIAIKDDFYTVTAIDETLNKTNIGLLQVGSKVNLERGMKLGDRLDGHLVQGHVDQIGECIGVKEAEGSWIFTFKYSNDYNNITIEKGSITINGISLTVMNSKLGEFSVAIIPYTYKNTNINKIEIGDIVNLEFDVIGKYVVRLNS